MTAAALNAIALGAHAAGSDVIRVGVVGCGGRGAGAAMNAMDADPGVRLVAMADLFEDRVKSKRDLLKQKKPDQVAVDDAHCFAGLDGYRKVIESADVVLIACAPKFHAAYTRAAIEAGKHVFVEKAHAIDPPGVRDLIAARDLAKQKKLSIVSGLYSRYDPGYQETIKRVQDGAIGDIVAIEESALRGPYGLLRRTPGLTELHHQLANWSSFAWLSGDDLNQGLIHGLDRANWAMGDGQPIKCHGLGGRSSPPEEAAGSLFDHHSVVYEYANGVRLYAFCRTQTGCYGDFTSVIRGTKGRCLLAQWRIEGQTKWRYRRPEEPTSSPYDVEHQVLFKAIRSGTPVNNGDYMVRSSMAAVMGQVSCYTGKEVTWDQAMKSNFTLGPKPEECRFDMEPPVKPDEKGIYPVPIPGQTKM
jgi:predicted dehydrogenase